jgi:hypothetical protein
MSHIYKKERQFKISKLKKPREVTKPNGKLKKGY